MKTLQLVFEKKGLQLSDDLKDLSEQEITIRVIKNIILSYAVAKRGLKEEERRLYYKICDAFEKLLEPKKDEKIATEIQLDDKWIGFIRSCKREATLMPDNLLQKVEGLIDAVKDR